MNCGQPRHLLCLSGKSLLAADRFRRLVASVCLAIYVLGGVGALPELLAAAASLEGSHQVRVRVEQGQTTVLLHHPGTAAHTHGLASRLVCRLQSSCEASPDHSATFISTSLCEATQGRSSAPERVDFCMVPLALNAPAQVPHADLFKSVSCATLARTPAGSPLAGSTILLI